jgi:hypothetical protein
MKKPTAKPNGLYHAGNLRINNQIWQRAADTIKIIRFARITRTS